MESNSCLCLIMSPKSVSNCRLFLGDITFSSPLDMMNTTHFFLRPGPGMMLVYYLSWLEMVVIAVCCLVFMGLFSNGW